MAEVLCAEYSNYNTVGHLFSIEAVFHGCGMGHHRFGMDEWHVILCIAIVVILVYFYAWWRYGAGNTKSVQVVPGGESYHVHREHADSAEAAKLMEQLNDNAEKFIAYMEKKYVGEHLRSFDPDHSNAIDVIGGTGMYYSNPIDKDIMHAIGSVEVREYLQERIMQLAKNYNPDDVWEISPKNRGNFTSYMEDKRKLVMCLRSKEPDANGNYPLHDLNLCTFVMLHELTHAANNTLQHPQDFWQLFKLFLENAVDAGIYKPINYHDHPTRFCGLDITYSPYFDTRLSDDTQSVPV
jgi:hypothetical protein